MVPHNTIGAVCSHDDVDLGGDDDEEVVADVPLAVEVFPLVDVARSAYLSEEGDVRLSELRRCWVLADVTHDAAPPAGAAPFGVTRFARTKTGAAATIPTAVAIPKIRSVTRGLTCSSTKATPITGMDTPP